MDHDQFSLPFLDTTSLSGGFGLYGGSSAPKRSPKPAAIREDAELFDTPVLEPAASDETPIPTPAVAAQDYRLAGDRRLGQTWKERAEDNLAAIRLMTAIEVGRPPRPSGRAGAPRQIRRLRRLGCRRQGLPPRRPGFRAGMGGYRPRARTGGLARGPRKPQARDAIRPFHARVHRPRHLAGAPPHGLFRRARPRARLRDGPLLRPCAGAAVGQARADRRRNGRDDRPDRKTPLSERPHPPRGFHEGEIAGALRSRDRQPALLGPHRARRRSGRGAAPFPARLFHRALRRAAAGPAASQPSSPRAGRWTRSTRKAREHIASMADLVGAVRLPEGAMHDRAGTDVVVDILFLQRRDAGAAPAGASWDSLSEAVPAEDGDPALSINRYFVEHPEMALGTHARTTSAYGPVYTLKPVVSTEGALSDLLAKALDRLPRDLFKPAAALSKPSFQSKVRVGTAADGAAIKEGSYLVHEGQLVQIVGGEPQAVAVRDGKGTEGIPAKHARIIRGLIAVRDAVREVLRTQANDEPWGPAQIRLRSAYALFVRNFGPINLTTISQTVTADGRDARDLPPAEPSALPRRPRRLARRLDRGLRPRKRNGEARTDLPRTRAPSRDDAADRDGRGRARRHVARDRPRRPRPHRRASRPLARDGHRELRRAHLPRSRTERRHEPRRLGDGRRLSLGQGPRQAHGGARRRGARSALSAQCRRAREDPARGPEAVRHHRPPRRAVDSGRRRRRLLGRGPRRQDAGLSHGRDRAAGRSMSTPSRRSRAPRPIGARPVATPANCSWTR